MLLNEIRTVSSHHHQKLENSLLPYLSAINSIADYALLLEAFYGYISVVEQKISEEINPSLLPDLPKRRSAQRILNDLEELGRATEGLELASDIPAIAGSSSAFGALYVLEGSTLGGKTISKIIAEKLGSEKGITFFKGYGPETGYMWKEFLARLENEDNFANSHQVAETASETFRLFDSWLQQHLSLKKIS